MLNINIICVGKLKELWLNNAQNEYIKRLSPYCSINVTELSEKRLPDNPSPKEITAALDFEGEKILNLVPQSAFVVALCIEGSSLSSQEFADFLNKLTVNSHSKIYIVIGGSYGLSDKVKSRSDFKLSFSKMTFPHHLARILLLEQLYRSLFSIIGGGKYHK